MTPIPVAPVPVHPRGPRARVLLSSVFGPYAVDDEYGSRRVNPMELHHNQVTRVQGPFSLRMFHRSWGLMMIQSNLEAPCTLLDFPDQDRFVAELRAHPYDVVGISGIVPNVKKVAKMCKLVREHRPEATIVVGGHVTGIADLESRIDADHLVRGEGIRWMRTFLGEDPDRPIRHSEIESAFGIRTLGRDLVEKPADVTAAVVPSVGCPMGCDFCCTSAMFGGKGRHVPFYETGDEIFDLLAGLESSMGVSSFFVMDENFLLYRRRVRRLLELMERHDKAWSFSVFSSANAVRSYSMDEIVRLGVSWVWMGLEGENSDYAKLDGVDTIELVRDLRANGIRVQGSTIVGLPGHTPDNLDAVIDRAVLHDSDFHQFMLYMPMPGTPLHSRMDSDGRLVGEDECELADVHGQSKFNYRHWGFPAGREGEFLLRAFERDYEVNGPSIARVAETLLKGWRRHRRHPDPRVRRRVAREGKGLATTYSAVVGAARRYFRKSPAVRARLDRIRAGLVAEFGLKARISESVGGCLLALSARREERRLARGLSLEPRTFYEKNEAALALDDGRGERASACRQVWVAAPEGRRHATRTRIEVPAASPAG